MKKFPFGLDKDQIDEQFIAIANGLTAGDVIPQAVSFSEDHRCDDFVIRTVSLTFGMRVEQEDTNGEG